VGLDEVDWGLGGRTLRRDSTAATVGDVSMRLFWGGFSCTSAFSGSFVDSVLCLLLVVHSVSKFCGCFLSRGIEFG